MTDKNEHLSIIDCLTLPRMILWKTVSGIEFFERRDTGAKHGLAWAAAITVFLSFAVSLPVSAQLEYVTDKPSITEQKEPIEKKAPELLEVTVELINEKFYEPGTIEQLEKLESEIQLVYDDTKFKKLLRGEVETAFSQVEENTDLFLDHYYSLQGKYFRIKKTFTRGLDKYLKTELETDLETELETDLETKLETALETNDPFKNVNALISREQQIRADFVESRNKKLSKIKNLTDKNEITVEAQQSPRVTEKKHSSLLLMKHPNTALPIPLNSLRKSGDIVESLVTRVVGKGLIKTLAAAIGKVTVKRAAGAGTGVVVGGIIGSVIPGIGTGIGAVIGGGIGAITSTIVVELVEIQLDEIVNRDEFKEKIISEIQKQKQELLNTL